jgi:SulP family sulfate permease
MLIAVLLAGVGVWLFHLPVETIGTRFGGIPSVLPAPAVPPFSLAKIQDILPDALSFALLGAIESLLSATVADGMTGRRHRSNMELVAQGIANFASALFGGICATGTVARTATNVRAGARSPISGMLHALFVLLFMAVAAPLASYIPLATLAGVLAVVAWNMVEKQAFVILVRSSAGDAVVVIATFLLTVLLGLTQAIVVGFSLGALLFLHRMAQSAGVEEHVPPIPEDRPDFADPERRPYDPAVATDPDVAVYRITGAFFFGAAATVGSVLDRIADAHRAFVLDFSQVPFIDSTAANTIVGIARKAEAGGVALLISGASPAVRSLLASHGVAGRVRYAATIEEARALAHATLGERTAIPVQ